MRNVNVSMGRTDVYGFVCARSKDPQGDEQTLLTVVEWLEVYAARYQKGRNRQNPDY